MVPVFLVWAFARTRIPPTVLLLPSMPEADTLMAHRWDNCPRCEGDGMGWAALLPTWDELYESGDHCDCHCHAGNITCQTCGKVVPEWVRFKAERLG